MNHNLDTVALEMEAHLKAKLERTEKRPAIGRRQRDDKAFYIGHYRNQLSNLNRDLLRRLAHWRKDDPKRPCFAVRISPTLAWEIENDLMDREFEEWLKEYSGRSEIWKLDTYMEWMVFDSEADAVMYKLRWI